MDLFLCSCVLCVVVLICYLLLCCRGVVLSLFSLKNYPSRNRWKQVEALRPFDVHVIWPGDIPNKWKIPIEKRTSMFCSIEIVRQTFHPLNKISIGTTTISGLRHILSIAACHNWETKHQISEQNSWKNEYKPNKRNASESIFGKIQCSVFSLEKNNLHSISHVKPFNCICLSYSPIHTIKKCKWTKDIHLWFGFIFWHFSSFATQ